MNWCCRRLALWVMALVLGAAGGIMAGDVSLSQPTTAPSRDEARARQDEERRRGGMCMNSRVYAPAVRESQVPRDAGDVPVIDPRIRERHDKILCYAMDGETLWAADDQCLHEISAGDARLIRTYTLADGLPDSALQSIAADGPSVWLSTLAGLARLDRTTGTVAAVDGVRFTIGTLTAGPSGVWLVSDRGAWHVERGGAQWRKLPEFPGRKALSAQVEGGFWWFMWSNKEIATVEQMIASSDGLYVLHNKQVWRYDPAAGAWASIGRDAWQIAERNGTLWAMCTDALVQYDPKNGPRRHEYGKGPAAGRPVAMAVGDDASYMVSHGRYNDKAQTFSGFTGGGISRLDVASNQWQVLNEIDGTKLNFADALIVDGGEAWASVMLFDKVIEEGAHPGMAHVKRWVPHPDGIGVAHYADGKWSLLQKRGLKTQDRWMGPHGTNVELDKIGPQNVTIMCRTPGRLWGAYRIVPEHWYGGFGMSAGLLAMADGGAWRMALDARTAELGLGGEHAALFGMSRSHGDVFLAEGHLLVLGVERIGGRCWIITQGGVYAQDPKTDRFAPVVAGQDRMYFRGSAAAAAKDCVWFGGDGGTISRMDRKTGRVELVGVVLDRQITALRVVDDRLLVGTAEAPGTYRICLPESMKSAPRLPVGDTLMFDGRQWALSTMMVPAAAPSLRCRYSGPNLDKGGAQVNYLYRGDQKAAFLRGVFRPEVLCEDTVGGRLWLGIYSGIASIPLEVKTDGKSGN